MEKAVRAYREVLRLIRKLPRDTMPYYSKYARESFVNYREIEASDIQELLSRTYKHCVWVLQKHSVEESVVGRLKEICRGLKILQPGKKWTLAYAVIVILLGCISVVLEAVTWVVLP